MGTSTTPDQLARKLDKLAKDIGNPRIPLGITALHVKGLFEASAAGAGVLGGRVAGRRKAIGVRYNLRGQGQHASAVVSYTGPAHLVNNPTRAHLIEPRGLSGRGRSRGARALTIGDDLRASAHHPGTRGKGFFGRAKIAAAKTAPRVYARAGLTEPLRRTF